MAKLDEIDFAALINSMTDAAKATRDLAGSPELKETMVQLRETASGMKTGVASITKTTDHLDARLGPLIDSLKKTSDQTTLTLASAQGTLTELNGTLDPDSPLGYQVIRALDNVSQASRAVTALADYLQRNPSALVRGKVISSTRP